MQITRIPDNEPHFIAVVCVCFIGNQDDVLLLQKRKDDPVYPNLWGFPAGKVIKSDRSFKHAACREILEETGNIVSENKLMPFSCHAYEHQKPNGKPIYFYARSFFLADFLLTTFRLNKAEHKAALIVPAEEIPGMNSKFFIPDSHQSFFNLYLRLKKIGRL